MIDRRTKKILGLKYIILKTNFLLKNIFVIYLNFHSESYFEWNDKLLFFKFLLQNYLLLEDRTKTRSYECHRASAQNQFLCYVPKSF